MTQPASPSSDGYLVIPEHSQLSLAIRLRRTNDDDSEGDLIHVSDTSDDALSILSFDANDHVQSPQPAVIADAPEEVKRDASSTSSPQISGPVLTARSLPWAGKRSCPGVRVEPYAEPVVNGEDFQGPYGTSLSSTAFMTPRRTTDLSPTRQNTVRSVPYSPSLRTLSTSDTSAALHKSFDDAILRYLIQHALLHAPRNSATASLFRDERLQAQMLRRLVQLPQDNVVRRVLDRAQTSTVSARNAMETGIGDVSSVSLFEISVLTDVEILAMHFLTTHHLKQFETDCSLPRLHQLHSISPEQQVPLKAQTLALEIEEILLRDDTICLDLDFEARRSQHTTNNAQVPADVLAKSSYRVRQDALNDIKSICHSYNASLTSTQRHEANATVDATQKPALPFRPGSPRGLSLNLDQNRSVATTQSSLPEFTNRAKLAEYQQQMKLLELQIRCENVERKLAQPISPQAKLSKVMQRQDMPVDALKEDYAEQLKILEAANRRRLAVAATAGAPAKPSALQDYEMQLAILEQQNKKRKAMQLQCLNSKSAKRPSRTSFQAPANFLELEYKYIKERITKTISDSDPSVCGFYRELWEYWQDGLENLSEEQRELPMMAVPTLIDPRPDSQMHHIDDHVIRNFKDAYDECAKALKEADSQLALSEKNFPGRRHLRLRMRVEDQQATTTTAHRYWLNSKFEHRYRHVRALQGPYVRGPSSPEELQHPDCSVFGTADEQYCWVCTKHRLNDPVHRLLRDASKRPAGRVEQKDIESSSVDDEQPDSDASMSETEMSYVDIADRYLSFRSMPEGRQHCQCKRCSIIITHVNFENLKTHIQVCECRPRDPFPKNTIGDSEAELKATSAAVKAGPVPDGGHIMDIDVCPQPPSRPKAPKDVPSLPEPKYYQEALEMLEEQCRRRMRESRAQGLHE